MKIVYLHQYFKTPNQAGGTRSYWVAKSLAEKGIEVVIISGRQNKSENTEIEIIEKCKVIFIHEPYDNDMSLRQRIKAFLSFSIKSTILLFKEKNVNLIFASSTPLTIGIPAILVKFIRRTPYIFEVRDLWPEVPIQMGALRNKVLKKFAIFMEKSIYKNSKHVIALSPGMQEGVLKFIPEEKTSMIPNMSKTDCFYIREHNIEIIREYDLDRAKFNIIHFGAMGISNGLDYIIDAAKIANDEILDRIQFIFLGGGKVEKELKEEVELYNLKNVSFLGKKPMNVVSEIVNICDVSIVSFADIDILTTNSPNKLFDSLSAGKPIIVNSNGWTKDMVEENNCGFFVNPKDPNDLINKIEFLMENKMVVEEMGKNSRSLALSTYDKSILVPKVTSIIERFLV